MPESVRRDAGLRHLEVQRRKRSRHRHRRSAIRRRRVLRDWEAPRAPERALAGRISRSAPASPRCSSWTSECWRWVLAWSVPREIDFPPRCGRCALQITAQVRQLLELRGHDRCLDDMLVGDVARAARAAARQGGFAIPAARNLPSQYFALADQARGELRGSAVFAARTAQDQGIAAILYNRLGLAGPVQAGNLRDRLESQDTAASEFSQPRQRVLEPVDGAQRVEFIDDKPQPLIIARRSAHRLEYGEMHPGGDHGTQCRDLAGAIRNEQNARVGPIFYPLAHRKHGGALALDILERGHGGPGYRAGRSEHPRIVG